MRLNRLLTIPAAAALAPTLVGAQDVEMLAEQYGTTVPAAYYIEMARDPDAFRFSRGFRPELRFDDAGARRGGSGVGPLAVLGRRDDGVTGTFIFPLLLGRYTDTPGNLTADVGGQQNVTLTRGVVQQEFFDGPNSLVGTIPEYYSEVSGGLVTLVGDTRDWVQSTLSAAQVAGSGNGLSSADGVGEFIIQLIQGVDDGSIDWGRYDNDGPDGVPDSGDDDGFVDVLAVMHPTAGAECTGEATHVWSHRWTLSGAAREFVNTALGGFPTSTTGANGGPILINDYTIQPVLSCSQTAINQIGVFAHELGHGFGLPDLYAVGASHGAVGRWGLMGSGSWGCNGGNPASPCHMTAWSKEALGWITATTLAPGSDLGVLTLDPVETTGQVFRLDAGDGSGDYYLLENRQELGFDVNLFSSGLLVWQIDTQILESQWGLNHVNSQATRMGVWLRQADGRNELGGLAGDRRGDASDPFPGQLGRTAFHAGTVPSAFTFDGLNGQGGVAAGTAAGVTLLDIQEVGQQVQFRVLTRYQTITMETEGTTGSVGLFTVDGVKAATSNVTFSSAPFQAHTLEAAGGELSGTGFRNGFIRWEDGSPRVREWVTGLEDATLMATYGNPEVSFSITLESPVPGIEPGSVVTNPESETGWVALGTEVSVLAEARTGFAFREWTGSLAGHPNPTTVTLTQPTSAGAEFDVAYGFADAAPTDLQLEAAATRTIAFPVENGNPPVAWEQTGDIPVGMVFQINSGNLLGAPFEMGVFTATITATDAIGLEASQTVRLNVGPPSAGLQTMAAPFLLAGSLDLNLRVFLDLEGNRDGEYDLGDFRAWVLGNPDHPVTQTVRAVDPIVIPLFLRKEEAR